MIFQREADFEEALVKVLFTKGWENKVLMYPTEEDLIQNWADILFENNKGKYRLNGYPLTKGEMNQILEQIRKAGTPLKINGFINGASVTVKRDNPDDTDHLGKEVSLKIYDRQEIAAGQSRYQIVRQPQFLRKNSILNDRRGDLMLLINGMPVIHIELKRTGIPISQACNQIEKYSHEGIFTGLFALIQIFVAMTPDETVYFANPGPEGKFNKDFYFHWANFNNDPINDWKDIASTLLSIPMAHQLIGFYTVADNTDGVLKVMRSYQYWAASRISDKVTKSKWTKEDSLGGFVWHTTGSGKTMTSFKSAQLIANAQDADKVVFLMDRIELGTQSLNEYRGFAEEADSVQSTENTGVLLGKLKSDNPADTLIVTSIQKMSNIKPNESGLNAKDIELINTKKIVFIVDECHRSTFGEMLIGIKRTFTNAMFFGFTGTPIHDENQKNMNTTATVFGDELHRYSIADGIRDGNVLGFDPVMVTTFDDSKVRKAVALYHAKSETEAEALADNKKKAVYLEYMDRSRHPMAGYVDSDGTYLRGIEDDIPKSQYQGKEHQEKVVENILDNFPTLSCGGRFHAIFATSSIHEAIEYYRLIREKSDTLKVTALFDENIDNNEGAIFKEDGLIEIIKDYNERYGQKFDIPTFQRMKKDVASRLAHKDQYVAIGKTPDQQIDLLIVVDQMLTGFDSKWINTLYLDKVLRYEGIIQAFSRTNRLFDKMEKPFGNIRYYRYPHTMKRNIEDAVKLYSGDKEIGLFVPKLERNLKKMNHIFEDIKDVFANAEIVDFSGLPQDNRAKIKFALLFKEFNNYLAAAKIQGFIWEKREYEIKDRETGAVSTVNVQIDYNTYLILALRYKEIWNHSSQSSGEDDVPFDLDGHLAEIDTGLIDTAYMDSRFEKYRKLLIQKGVSPEVLEQALDDLHRTFASLSQEEQKYANVILHDMQTGDVYVEEGKSLKDYIAEYMSKAKNEQVMKVVRTFGLDEKKLNAFLEVKVTEDNINEFGRFEDLKASADPAKTVAFFERKEGKKIPVFKARIKLDTLLRQFIIDGEFDIDPSDKNSEKDKLEEINYLSNQYELPRSAEGLDFTTQVDENKDWSVLSIGGWVFYQKLNASDELPKDKCGKWMHWFNNKDFAERICKEAIGKGIVVAAKHSDDIKGVCCFYLRGDDLEAHKRVLQFFLDNHLIRKTKSGRLYNISFKYDNQTRAGEYDDQFKAEIKLDQFVDLETGEFLI